MDDIEAEAPPGSIWWVCLAEQTYYVEGRTSDAVLTRAAEEAGIETPKEHHHQILGPLYGDEVPDDEGAILQVEGGADS
jgi:hypothetical protein